MMELNTGMTDRLDLLNSEIQNYLLDRARPRHPAIEKLIESMQYSLEGGGKRFRPLLGLLLSEALGVGPKRVLSFLIAIEMIHTYSLIHDDLPCMDDDDFRRGKPSNHKKYGEALALLAGDAFLTEAFYLIAYDYADEPELAVKLIKLLSQAAGLAGMVGGQAIDVQDVLREKSLQELNLIHKLKTGALIQCVCEGVGQILGLANERQKILTRFGSNLGLAFQLADDVLDSQTEAESGSFPELIGYEETRRYLAEVTEEAQRSLRELGLNEGALFELVQFNSNRNS